MELQEAESLRVTSTLNILVTSCSVPEMFAQELTQG